MPFVMDRSFWSISITSLKKVYLFLLRPQNIFSLQEEGKKEAVEHFKHVLKLAQIEVISFGINYG